MENKISKRYLEAIIFLIFGIIGVCYVFGKVQMVHVIHNWSISTGKILESRMSRDLPGEGFQSRPSSMEYTANISYVYEVEGKTYKSNRVFSEGNTSIIKSQINNIIREFPEGKIVELRYNPDNPSESVLINELNIFDYLGGAISLLAILASLMFFIKGFRKAKNSSP